MARADDPKDLDPARVKAAIEKGVAWLKTQQDEAGRFDDGYAAEFPMGASALAALALAKCAERGDPAAAKALDALETLKLRRTYDAGIAIMAVEGRYAPREEELVAATETYAQLLRKAYGKAAPGHRKIVSSAAEWLVRSQHKEIWGYPFGGVGEEDHSNTQYALLGLGAARRLGHEVSTAGLERALHHFLRVQQQDGPDIPPFVVPAADHSAKDVERLAQDLRKAKEKASEGLTEVRRFYETAARTAMVARGFAYFGAPGETGGHPAAKDARLYNPDLSMTTAGLAALITLKWALEGKSGYPAKKTDQAIRDAAAYIAQNWKLGSSPDHDYYTLYGIERTGAMTGCPFFGKHDWYVEGGEWILARQNDDGSWGKHGPVSNKGLGAPESSLPDTCFALLFLRRASVPIVPPIPKRVVSGLK